MIYLIHTLRLRYWSHIIERLEAQRLTYLDDYRDAVAHRNSIARRLRSW